MPGYPYACIMFVMEVFAEEFRFKSVDMLFAISDGCCRADDRIVDVESLSIGVEELSASYLGSGL